MLFNSFDFLAFLVIVFLLYWFVFAKNLRLQNGLIVIASFVFYGWWDWRFLVLLMGSGIVDFILAKQISDSGNQGRKRLFLLASLVFNLGVLAYFKYANFFVENLAFVFGYQPDLNSPFSKIILPLGISFYTLQTLSYVFDVYRDKTAATKDLGVFLAFISFFPQLVAGPIERAGNLLVQFENPRAFSYSEATYGLRRILWGLFKKIVVADNCGVFVNSVYGDPEIQSGGSIVLATFLFGIQIYCDFSGYSEIAIGTARLFGIKLMENFHYPYFSPSLKDFWRRWHISLMRWFRDYVYFPMGGSKHNAWKTARNVLIVFTLSGLWHGANLTFIMWGVTNGLLFLLEYQLNRGRKNQRELSWTPVIGTLLVFLLINSTWIFFRSDSIGTAIYMITRIFSDRFVGFVPDVAVLPVGLSLLLLTVEALLIQKKDPWLLFADKPRFVRWSFYVVVIISMGIFAVPDQPFLYFQF